MSKIDEVWSEDTSYSHLLSTSLVCYTAGFCQMLCSWKRRLPSEVPAFVVVRKWPFKKYDKSRSSNNLSIQYCLRILQLISDVVSFFVFLSCEYSFFPQENTYFHSQTKAHSFLTKWKGIILSLSLKICSVIYLCVRDIHLTLKQCGILNENTSREKTLY